MAKIKYNWEFLSLARFLLAFIVLTNHLKDFTNIGFLDWYGKFGSFEAILGFLLISGFSIGKSIQKNQESYFKRRIFRIYPVYLASIILVFIANSWHFDFSSILMLLINLLFLNQVVTNSSLVGPAWSLSLEVWMYALAPLLLKASHKLLLIIAGTSFMCFILYTAGRTLFHWPYYSGTMYGVNLVLLSFIWVLGYALATHDDKKQLFAKCIAVVFVLHVLLDVAIQLVFRFKHHTLAAFPSDMVVYLFGATCLFCVYYVVVLNHRLPVLSDPVKKVFHLLGDISYPLYLVHYSVFVQFKKINILNIPVMIAATLLSAYIIYFVFDFYSKKRPVA